MTPTAELVDIKCPACGHSPVEKHPQTQNFIINKTIICTEQMLYHCPVCNKNFMQLEIQHQ